MLLVCLVIGFAATWAYSMRGWWGFVIMLGAVGLLFSAWAVRAQAGVDNPTKFDGIHLVHRCPKTSNPIECRERSKPARAIPKDSRLPKTNRCTLNRDIYEYHHGLTGKPRRLRGYYGCRLYKLDAAYHRELSKLNVPDDLQEAAESALNALGASPEQLMHIALTAAPQ